jgi:hypothetical protein
MRIGARRRRATQLRRAVAEYELSLRRAQQNHGAGQHELFGCRFHRVSKCDWVERLEICCGCCRSAEGARHGNHKCQDSRGYNLTPWSCRRVSWSGRRLLVMAQRRSL